MKRLLILILFVAKTAHARLDGNVIPSHYRLLFEPNLAAGTFRGEETIDVEVRKPSKDITLNAIEIVFDSASVTSGGKKHAARVSLDPDSETATLHLDREISGAATVAIAFRGRLNDQLRGFYLSRTNARRYAVTQFEATDARRAFPSFDEPAMKATFDISVIVDKGDTAISNGRIVSDKPRPHSRQHTIRFATTPKMSTYLVALLVGDFQCSEGGIAGVPIRICATPDKVQLTKFALRATEKELAFYNDYYGIKYPFGKLDIIAVPDFEAGAMENTAAITFRETALLVDENGAVGAQKKVAEVVAHEVAHQWFGDLVTMKWWNDVWLNEGFADWITPKAVAAFNPAWRVADDQALDTAHALDTDALQSTHPIRVTVETPEEINEIFDAISYNKTAAVLRMVEGFVGEPAFREGIRAYVRKYAYSNAAAEDFWSTMTAVTKQPFDRMMPSFVQQPGAPLVSVSTRCDGDTTILGLSQRRMFRSRARFLAGSNERWAIPLVIKDLDHPQNLRKVLFSDAAVDVKMAGCTPNLFVNAGGTGYYRTQYASQSAPRNAQQTLTSPEQIVYLNDEWALVQIGERSVPDYLAEVQRFQGSRDRGVLTIIANALSSIGKNMTTPADQAAYASWVRTFLSPLEQSLGWTPAPGESDEERQLRAVIIRTLGETGGDAETLRHARALAGALLKDRSAVDASLRSAVLDLAAIDGDAALYDAYVAQLDKSLPPDDHYNFVYALSSFRDPALLKRSLDYGLSERIRSQDRPSFLGSLIENPALRKEAWNYLQAHWGDVQSTISPWSMPYVVRSVGSLCDEGDADDVKKFFDEHRERAAARTVRQSIEQIAACAETRTLQAPRLETMVEGH